MVAHGKIAAPFAVAPHKVAQRLGVATQVVRVRVREAATARLPEGFAATVQSLLGFGKVTASGDGRVTLVGRLWSRPSSRRLSTRRARS